MKKETLPKIIKPEVVEIKSEVIKKEISLSFLNDKLDYIIKLLIKK